MKFEFSVNIFEKYSYFKKMCSVGAELFLAGGWTDGQTHEDSTVAFRNFANAPKNW